VPDIFPKKLQIMFGAKATRPFAAFPIAAATGVLLISTMPYSVLGVGRVSCTNQTYHAFGKWPQELDYGIWWYGRNQTKEKAVKGQTSSLFDPTKKTVVYIHGWSGANGGFAERCQRPTTVCTSAVCEGSPDVFVDWFDDWNVGFFYWDQFGDEPCARDAEQKIWFDRSEGGMRYSTYDFESKKKSYSKLNRPGVSVADLCVESVNDALDGFSGDEFRLVGHSLGTQLATRCAALLRTGGVRNAIAPTRLVLLDPFFTKYHFKFIRCHSVAMHQGIGEFSLKQVTSYIKTLYGNGVPTVVHISSPFPEDWLMGDTIFPFEPLVILVKHNIQWCGNDNTFHPHNMGCAHNAAEVVYFYRNGLDKNSIGECRPEVPFACTDKELWIKQTEQIDGSVKGTRAVILQTKGRNTRDPTDDEYRDISVKMNAREKLAFIEANAFPIFAYPKASIFSGARDAGARIAVVVAIVVICAAMVAGAKLNRKNAFVATFHPLVEVEKGILVPAE